MSVDASLWCRQKPQARLFHPIVGWFHLHTACVINHNRNSETDSMSHHYSGPNIGFPHGDARLDLTDLFAFPNPGNVGKSILISLVFIDETAVTTKMVRHYGRSPRGERLVASVPHGHWKTLTFIAALRFDGMTAPYVIDGAMDGPTFLAYVEQ